MNREEAGLVQAVREKLQEEVEENYRIFQAGLLPGVNNLLGVRLGTLRKIARTIARKSPYIYLEAAPDVYFEEDMLCGMLIGYVKMEEAVRKRELKRFVPRIGNWSVCDSCCASWHFLIRAIMPEWRRPGPYPSVISGFGKKRSAFWKSRDWMSLPGAGRYRRSGSPATFPERKKLLWRSGIDCGRKALQESQKGVN